MEEKLLSILEEICDDEIVREDKDVDLFETDLIDSLGVVNLMVAIEEEFGITLAPTEIEREEFNTPNRIISYLKDKGVK